MVKEGSHRLRRLTALVSAYLPRLLPAKVSRRFVLQANAARDARLYEVAASLLEEALHFTPRNGRLHLQCGHMFKEARDYASAEEHYREAQRLLPHSADLALQLGHFYKMAGRAAEAEAAYDDALRLQPGWQEAQDEIARVRAGASDLAHADPGQFVVSELLPRGAGRHGPNSDMIRVLRLGGSRVRSQGGMLKVLRGVEAIRGFCASSVPVETLELLVDDAVVSSLVPQSFAIDGSAIRRKYVFNIWHDFAEVPIGRHELTLRFVLENGRRRQHREHVMVAIAPMHDALPDSDAFVRPEPGGSASVEAKIDALPSMIRSVERSPLPQQVRTILVQRADQLGDLVCSVPAIRRLRTLFPDARLIGLLTEANAGLARSLGIFDEVVVADYVEDPAERRRTMSAARQAELNRILAAYAFDLAIDLGEGSESRPLLLLSGARFLYGFKEREFPWLSAGMEMNGHDPVNALENTPPSRKMLALVETLGAMHHGAATAMPRTDLMRDSLAEYGIGDRQEFIVLHTGARLSYSRWPGFGELVALLLERTNLLVVILVDDPTEAALFGRSERIRVIGGRMPFDHFDALLTFCAAFVGNDSGPKHLASLRGAKVVSLHMARLNWNEWGQEISGSIISRRVPCAGCAISYDAEDCGKDFACIRKIRPMEVFGAVQALLPA